MIQRIAFAKTAWSNSYEGGPTYGLHKFLENNSKQRHECFNFKQGPDGFYYGYVPPLGAAEAPPKPDQATGWVSDLCREIHGNGADYSRCMVRRGYLYPFVSTYPGI